MQEVISKYLTDNVKLVKIKDHSTAGTSTITSDEVDARGYSGACFFSSFGTANSGNLLTVHQAAATTEEAASEALKTSGSSDEDVVVDIIVNPAYPFLKLVATVGSSSTVESMWVILYGARSKSQDNSTTGTIALGQFESPDLA